MQTSGALGFLFRAALVSIYSNSLNYQPPVIEPCGRENSYPRVKREGLKRKQKQVKFDDTKV